MAATKIMSYTDFVRDEIVDSYSDSELINKWNEYCDDTNDPDDQIFINDEEFLDLFSKEDIARRVCYGEYSPSNDYVVLDGYGNFKSSDFPERLLYKEGLTDWIVQNSYEENAYIDYVQRALSTLPLDKALQSYEAVADKREYIRDDSVSQIEIAIETSLETLVENSSVEQIEAAVKLNESKELVDLSDLKDYVNLDELTAHAHRATVKTPSLADDLQAAKAAANKQETVNPQGTLKHTNKL